MIYYSDVSTPAVAVRRVSGASGRKLLISRCRTDPSKTLYIPHFERVDIPGIVCRFSSDRKHRFRLTIPFQGRAVAEDLLVIGQNPSAADNSRADRTIRYLEELIFRSVRRYSGMTVCNLYSRIDSAKRATDDLNRPESTRIRDELIAQATDVLLVFGASRRQGAYDFAGQFDAIKPLLAGKKLLQLDAGVLTDYPPHPGNRHILYRNFSVRIAPYEPAPHRPPVGR